MFAAPGRRLRGRDGPPLRRPAHDERSLPVHAARPQRSRSPGLLPAHAAWPRPARCAVSSCARRPLPGRGGQRPLRPGAASALFQFAPGGRFVFARARPRRAPAAPPLPARDEWPLPARAGRRPLRAGRGERSLRAHAGRPPRVRGAQSRQFPLRRLFLRATSRVCQLAASGVRFVLGAANALFQFAPGGRFVFAARGLARSRCAASSCARRVRLASSRSGGFRLVLGATNVLFQLTPGGVRFVAGAARVFCSAEWLLPAPRAASSRPSCARRHVALPARAGRLPLRPARGERSLPVRAGWPASLFAVCGLRTLPLRRLFLRATSGVFQLAPGGVRLVLGAANVLFQLTPGGLQCPTAASSCARRVASSRSRRAASASSWARRASLPARAGWPLRVRGAARRALAASSCARRVASASSRWAASASSWARRALSSRSRRVAPLRPGRGERCLRARAAAVASRRSTLPARDAVAAASSRRARVRLPRARGEPLPVRAGWPPRVRGGRPLPVPAAPPRPARVARRLPARVGRRPLRPGRGERSLPAHVGRRLRARVRARRSRWAATSCARRVASASFDGGSASSRARRAVSSSSRRAASPVRGARPRQRPLCRLFLGAASGSSSRGERLRVLPGAASALFQFAPGGLVFGCASAVPLRRLVLRALRGRCQLAAAASASSWARRALSSSSRRAAASCSRCAVSAVPAAPPRPARDEWRPPVRVGRLPLRPARAERSLPAHVGRRPRVPAAPPRPARAAWPLPARAASASSWARRTLSSSSRRAAASCSRCAISAVPAAPLLPARDERPLPVRAGRRRLPPRHGERALPARAGRPSVRGARSRRVPLRRLFLRATACQIARASASSWAGERSRRARAGRRSRSRLASRAAPPLPARAA